MNGFQQPVWIIPDIRRVSSRLSFCHRYILSNSCGFKAMSAKQLLMQMNELRCFFVYCTTNDIQTTFLIGLFECTVSSLSNSVLNILQCDETDRLADLKDKLFSPSTILPTTLIAANVSRKYNFAIRNRYVLTQCPLTLNEQTSLRNQSSAFCFSIISL